MSPERIAKLVTAWVWIYTRGLPAPVAQRRLGEIGADLHDHIAYEREQRAGDGGIARRILSRMVRGLPGDAAWRGHHASRRTAYWCASALGLGSAFFLFWLIGAVGLIGESGDRADMMYLGVFAVGILGAIAARFRPEGMARTLLAMAVVQGLIAVIALAQGKHNSPVTSVYELVGLNLMFIVLFCGSAWLFREAARKPRRAGAPSRD